MRWVLLILVLAACTHQAESLKIIMLCVIGSQSHLNVFYNVAEGLIEAGHEVSLVSHYPPRKIPKLKELHLELGNKKVQQNDTKLADFLLGATESDSQWINAKIWYTIYTKFQIMGAPALEHEIIRKLHREGLQYDVAIANGFMNDCIVPLAVKIAKHLVMLSAADFSSASAYDLNVPYPSATIPSMVMAFSRDMTFIERAINSLCHFGFYIGYHIAIYPTVNQMVQEKYPDLPTVQEAKSKISMFLVNRVSATDGSIPLLPYVQEIGGINNRPPKSLPDGDLKSFIDSSGQAGFIYVALGSIMPIEQLAEEKKKMLIEAFSKIPQRVIFKFRENRTDIPSNVKVVSWAPQQDILGHPKCKAYVSHGGRLSTHEAIYHGVPVIGMPLCGDQPVNVAHAKYSGFALELQWTDLTPDTLANKLKEVINNPRYKENALLMSKRMRDQPQTAKEKAVYWIEYVVRHNGAKHLRTAADSLNFFQYFLLDIIGLAVLTISILCYVFYKLVRFFCSLYHKRSDKKLPVLIKKKKIVMKIE